MKLRFATLILALLGACTVFTMKMPAATSGAGHAMLGGGGAPRPCFPSSRNMPDAPLQDGVPCPNQ
jgi:hypothetical protein